ncbi:MAG: hypothetical protein FWD88_03300 [Treponema sp.]|nr:hypothetical protein [Treponema sp.]
MKAKRTIPCGLFAVIMVMALGMMVVACDTDMDVDNDVDVGNGASGWSNESVFDFPAFLAGFPLGNIAGGGRWPVWSTGQPAPPWSTAELSIVASGGARALRVPFGGAHGVDILLAGASGVGANLGYRLEIHGRIVVIATGNAATTQLAAIRSVDGGTPGDNLTTPGASMNIPASSGFMVYRVIQDADLARIPNDWRPGSSLRLVNQPSAPATVMYVTDILVFPRL